MERNGLEAGLRELLADLMEEGFFSSTLSCVEDNLEEASTQAEFLMEATWALVSLSGEASTWARKLLEYQGGRYGGMAKRPAADRPVNNLTQGEIGQLYNEYVQAHWEAEEMPRWKDLTPERQAEVLDIAARLLYVNGEGVSSNFTDAFDDRLRDYLAGIREG